MNYIKKLQEVERNRAEMIYGIKKYLNSEKFQVDNNVNKNDILIRIAEYEDDLNNKIYG